jgi:hypothetical protein
VESKELIDGLGGSIFKMKSDSDIGENTAIVLTLGIAIGVPLVFTGWLLNKALNLALPSMPPSDAMAALSVSQLRVTQAEVTFISSGKS